MATIRRKQQTSGKPIGMYINRWTDRAINPCLLTTLQQHEWEDSVADLWCAVHGKAPIDPPILEAEKAGRVRLLDLRAATTGKLPELVSECFSHGIDRYKVVGLLDDDACYLDPVLGMWTMWDAVCTCGAGAVGPMNPCRVFRPYRGDVKPGELKPMNRRPWSTDGSQLFKTELLRKTRELWEGYYDLAEFKTDFFLFMLAHALGYDTYEVLVPYKHISLQGSPRCSRVENDEWYERRKQETDHDYALITNMMAQWPQFDKAIRDIWRNEHRRIEKRYQQSRKDTH